MLRVEGDHLIVSPVRELCLDLGLFLFLVRIHRGHVWDWGPSGNDSPLAFRVLEPFRWAFCVPTHDRIEKRLRLQKSRLNVLFGGFLLIQLSALPDILAVSKILNLEVLDLTPM